LVPTSLDPTLPREGRGPRREEVGGPGGRR